MEVREINLIISKPKDKDLIMMFVILVVITPIIERISKYMDIMK